MSDKEMSKEMNEMMKKIKELEKLQENVVLNSKIEKSIDANHKDIKHIFQKYQTKVEDTLRECKKEKTSLVKVLGIMILININIILFVYIYQQIFKSVVN
jgi:hypothetical protein